MEPKFQTSFIPKKPSSGGPLGTVSIRRPKSAGTNLYMVLAVVVFVTSLLGIGGAFLWNQYLISAQNQYKNQLTAIEKSFDVNELQQLKQINVQIDTARQLLSQHLAISQLFQIISQFTIESVRFLSLDVTAPTADSNGLKISMSGYGANFSALAFQSQVLGSLDAYGLRDIVKNPIISTPTLDQGGTVSFGFTAAVDPSALSYEDLITGTTTPTN